MFAEIGHPCTAALGGAREEVGVNDTDIVSVGVSDVEPFHFWMEHDDVLVFGEMQAVEFCSKSKHAFDGVAEFEIRAKFLVVDAVFCVLELVRPE